MSRYIDADDVANAIYHHFPSVRAMADARGVIEEAPTIDIVRCKECKYAEVEGRTTHYLVCQRHPYSASAVDLTDFCSEGKRKESE